MEQLKQSAEKSSDNMPVPREELTALGIPENITMTRKELERHLETKKLQSAAEHKAGSEAVETLGAKMSRELSEEQIARAEQAGKKREETGR